MRIPFLTGLAFALCLAVSVRAQSYSPEQLDQLLGPIALYPDPLVALILPASTMPSDLTLAANYLAANGSPDGIDAQPWDPSVKGLAHYPSVVAWMNTNLDWTQALGAAFAQQPSDVMKSIQQLRAQARAAGSLVDTPQQTVDIEGDDIRIIPTQPDTIYVPEYDPDLVYESQDGYAGPFIVFGDGYPAGIWLGYQLDWDDFGIWIGPWSGGWAYRREWRDGGGGAWHSWRADPARTRALVRNSYRPESRLPTPRVIAGYRAPARAPGAAAAAARPSVSRAPSTPDFRGREAPAPREAAPFVAAPREATPAVSAPREPAPAVAAPREAAPEVSAPRPASPAPASPREAAPAPAQPSSLFGGYSRGTQTRDFSSRGQTSRAAPVRTPAPRASAPSRAPASGGSDRRGN